MTLSIFLRLSLTGIVSITLASATKDYYLIETPKTWSDAQSYCRNRYDDLAIVKTENDWTRLNDEAALKGLPATGWIGLQNYLWHWFWNGEGDLWDYSLKNWAPGQPDNFGGKEICAAINESGYWADYPCTDLKPFICYDDTAGFVPYPNSTMTWDDSLNYCKVNHKHLACATNMILNNELQALALDQGISWIGLKRFAWWWADRTSSEIPWSPGYPNNAEQHNNCGILNNSLVMDKLCGSKFYFFCHTRSMVKYKVLKLHIQGHISDFDHAVQSAILQQVVQKLKDHGISRRMKVKWRMQPDRSIFHKKSNDDL